MTEKTLKSAFEKLDLQPPSPGAEDRAIEAGLTAFRRNRQKSGDRSRPMFGAINTAWEWIMGHRMVFGAATAGVLAVAVVVGVTQTRVGHDAADLATSASDIADQVAKIASREEASPADAAKANGLQQLLASVPPEQSEQVEMAAADPGAIGNKVAADSLQIASIPEPTAQPVAPLPALPARPGALDRNAVANITSLRPSDFPSIPPAMNSPSLRSPAVAQSNELKLVSEAPVSTFSIDVDTASYAQVRRRLNEGVLPSPADVRVEEMINYFSYDYPLPEAGGAPFRPTVAVYPTPWNPDTKLLHIGIKGRDVVRASRPHANLVFLIDTSGSMDGPDRLPLLKTAFRMLVDTLGDDDTVAIVTYAGEAGTVLEPTAVRNKRKIVKAITELRPGGSTAGAAGIAEAYALAEDAFDANGVNRVILATDGDFNVGMTDMDALKAYIADKRKSGVFLSVLGFGEGNYNDPLMQVLAQNGNGNAAYIDSLKEAEKVLVHEATGTLFPIAKDVKIQIEFNPANVAAYRLIGYETRMLRRQDFNNDRIDAGEIGSGHTVTAIYEIVPAESRNRLVDDLRYAKPVEPAVQRTGDEYAMLKIRYKAPKSDRSELIELAVDKAMERRSVDDVGTDMRFAAAVAAFGQKLRGQPELEDYSYADIQALADSARGTDPFGIRSELVELVRLARYLSPDGIESSSGGRD